MMERMVFIMSPVLIICNYQTLANGNTICKLANVGGLVCVYHIKQLDDRPAFEYTRLVCTQTDEQGQAKVLKEKPGQILVNEFQQDRLLVKSKQDGRQPLRFAAVFRKISILVSKSCLSQSEDLVVDSKPRNAFIPMKTEKSEDITMAMAGDGYRKLGFGIDAIYVKRFNIKRTWDEAAKICHSENGTLVKIDTQRKMKAIKSKMSEPKDLFRKFFMWIGLRDIHRNNSFIWIDGSPLAFSHWRSGQPSHSTPLADGTDLVQDCVALVSAVVFTSKDLYWYDKNCDDKNGFICEINKM